MNIFPCLYTHQKLKKKKCWSDGELKVLASQGKCMLFALNEKQPNNLILKETKYLPRSEIDRILNGSADEIEFEGFLVTVEQIQTSIQTESVVVSAPKSNIKRPNNLSAINKPFKVPRVSIPVPPNVIDEIPMHKVPKSVSAAFGAYTVNDDELDDIWNNAHNNNNQTQNDYEDNVDSIQQSQNGSHNGSNDNDASIWGSCAWNVPSSQEPSSSNGTVNKIASDFNMHPIYSDMKSGILRDKDHTSISQDIASKNAQYDIDNGGDWEDDSVYGYKSYSGKGCGNGNIHAQGERQGVQCEGEGQQEKQHNSFVTDEYEYEYGMKEKYNNPVDIGRNNIVNTVGNSVGNSIGNSVGNSVGNIVGNSGYDFEKKNSNYDFDEDDDDDGSDYDPDLGSDPYGYVGHASRPISSIPSTIASKEIISIRSSDDYGGTETRDKEDKGGVSSEAKRNEIAFTSHASFNQQKIKFVPP